MIRLDQICCTSLRMELRNCNVNKIANIPQKHFILNLDILAFRILFVEDFNSIDEGINSEKLRFLVIL